MFASQEKTAPSPRNDQWTIHDARVNYEILGKKKRENVGIFPKQENHQVIFDTPKSFWDAIKHVLHFPFCSSRELPFKNNIRLNSTKTPQSHDTIYVLPCCRWHIVDLVWRFLARTWAKFDARVQLSPEADEEHQAVDKVKPDPNPTLAETGTGVNYLQIESELNLYKQKSIIHFLPKRSERAPKMTPPTITPQK